ncbi:MAG: YvcK family protein [Chloroflexi bacterium]|nr:MAG: YvcK family protein [Chloroflexota bacterium]
MCDHSSVNALRAVCVGGGLGAPTVMAGLRRHTDQITGLIAVTDSGRSTGKVRIALDVPAPGDIRSALTVLAEGDPALIKLFSHRFETEKSEELNGMAFGNLFLAALTQQEGSFLRAVEEASRLLRIRGRVIPVTLYNTHLCAKLADGSVVEEEVNVRAIGKAPIERIYLKDDDVHATDGSVGAIEQADLITIGPGSLFTTVCACLLVPEIARAIANAKGRVVYVANTTRQPGQTDGYVWCGTTPSAASRTSIRPTKSSRRSRAWVFGRCSRRSSTNGPDRGTSGRRRTRSDTTPRESRMRS